MKPIIFSCEESLPLSPVDIAKQILDVTRWPEFKGFGFIPGIRSARFEVQSPDIVGTRIRVENCDGSSHVEEIVHWQPDSRLALHVSDFSPPLARLAAGFDETWDFQRVGHATKVKRTFEMHARSFVTWPMLWMISTVLKKAIARHLRQMRDRAAA